jgi:hypothetical protein
MATFTPFPHIGRLPHLARELRYFPALPEVLTFEGTVKTHGTNTAVVQMGPDEPIFVQSRTRFITPETDNIGAAAFIMGHQPTFQAILGKVRAAHPRVSVKLSVNADGSVSMAMQQDVVLFGEFCGKGVQKGVGVSLQNTFLVLYDVVVGGQRCPHLLDGLPYGDRIFNVNAFGRYVIQVRKDDLDDTESDALAEAVGRDCPVARALGTPGAGEGIVWRCADAPRATRLWFKSKAPPFCIAQKQVRQKANPSIAEAAAAFAKAFATPARMRQGLDTVGYDKASMGAFIMWVVDDVMREEGFGLDQKASAAARKAVSASAALWLRRHHGLEHPENSVRGFRSVPVCESGDSSSGGD